MKRGSLICYCYSITEGEVNAAIAAGADNLAALQDLLKASTCCGSCAPRLQDCLDERTDPARATAAPQGSTSLRHPPVASL
jgi:NAD(P)H-nitrite reductase large subunit